MENNSIENMFCMTLGSDNVRLHEPMKKHTNFSYWRTGRLLSLSSQHRGTAENSSDMQRK